MNVTAFGVIGARNEWRTVLQDERIVVEFENGRRVRVWVDNESRLNISADLRLVVLPRAANLIYVEPAREEPT